MRKVAIASENPVKVQAAKKAFLAVWPREAFTFVNSSVSSGVSDQPMSDEESIQGAVTRAKKVQKKEMADFGVGLEGGIRKVKSRYFATAWMAVIDKRGNIGVGAAVSAPLGPSFMNIIKKGTELGKAVDIASGNKNSKQKKGYFGFITDNLITRESGYIDGTIMALGRFNKPKFFN
ncbi:DUF84 family protein [Patescibacteria group bacterium]|nr:DUF84 family protein [Patescibacteria group bacterium]